MGFFNIINKILSDDKPKKISPMSIATAYGITAPMANKIVNNVVKNRSKNGKKICRYCGEEIDLEDKFCSKCGKELGYIKENEAQDKGE